MKIKSLATDLNVMYTMEQLLTSPIIRNAINNNGLELHGAVLVESTGEVQVLGRHPQQSALLDEARYDY